MARADRRRTSSSAQAIGWAWAALVAYASLYPFTPWQWPPGADVVSLLWLPWPGYWDTFDIVANLVGYMPLGALFYVSGVRAGQTRRQALGRAMAVAALLSFGLEVAQNALPQRVPSLADWLLNTAGALLGAGLALGLHAWGVLASLRLGASRWLEHRGVGGLLLLAWPVGLLFPAPLPLGLGRVGGELRDWATAAVTDVPWAAPVRLWLEAIEPAYEPLSPAAEWLAITLGLLGPCLLAYAASKPGWRRLPLAAGALVVAWAPPPCPRR